MKPTYRVEAFIVPSTNRDEKLGDNEMDDVKFANKSKDSKMTSTSKTVPLEKQISVISLIKDFESIVKNEENYIKSSMENLLTSPSTKLPRKKLDISVPIITIDDSSSDNHLSDLDEPIYDVPIPWNQKRPLIFSDKDIKKDKIIEGKEIFGVYNRVPMRTSSLMSIDEHGETQDTDDFDQFCCHGFKNGCTAIQQKPEQVSEEVFNVNWLKRLEGLRVREGIIKDKEAMLFERERLLFKKEKELRILERLLKDKLAHAEKFLDRCQSQPYDFASGDGQNKYSDVFEDFKTSKDTLKKKASSESLENIQANVFNQEKSREIVKSTSSLSCESNGEGKSLKNPPNSKSSLMIASNIVPLTQRNRIGSVVSSTISKHPISGFNSHSSLRRKRRPKMTYDDLDSTLSADIGDSSYIVTSKKFDPEVFKKPIAFTRSNSLRNPENIRERPLSNIFEDEKVLKRMSENIFVSQDKDTKFQNYGLIDFRTRVEEKGHSYLDLDQGRFAKGGTMKIKKKEVKDGRPVSWNEESNEWLQRKRQAYNWATQRMPIEDFDTTQNHHNKENHVNDNKTEIGQKKKLVKGIKKFAIFR